MVYTYKDKTLFGKHTPTKIKTLIFTVILKNVKCSPNQRMTPEAQFSIYACPLHVISPIL